MTETNASSNNETSYVEVFSMLAAIGPSERSMWSGETPKLSGPEAVFRFFNRVNEADIVLLDELGYHLPSLSVGDYFTLDGSCFRVETLGFTELNDPANFVGAVLFGDPTHGRTIGPGGPRPNAS